MTFAQFLRILRARIGLVLLVLLLCVGAAVGISLTLPKQYEASAALILDVRSTDPLSGQALQGLVAPGYMGTQIDIIKSTRVATAVVRQLGLDNNPTVRQQWLEDTQGQGTLTDWLAALLLRNLDVKPARESNVITIGFTGVEPGFAAAVANAFAQAYINVNLDLRVVPARHYASFFQEQTQAARQRLEQAQGALSDYQQQQGITSADERLDYETARLNEVSSQLTVIQGQTTDSQSKRAQAQGDTVAEVMQSPLINSLKVDIARLEARLDESQINLGARHPQVQRQQAELATLRDKLGAETRQIRSSIETTYQVNRQREQQLEGALATQKARVLQLNRQRDQLHLLRREMESAQSAFDLVSQRAMQTSLEGQTSQTNIALLNAATAPLSPTSPRLVLNTAVGLFLGLLGAVGLAMALEMARPRVRSRDDLIEVLDPPLLASVGSARRLMRRTPLGIRA